MLYHPDINGQSRSFPIPYHRGRDLSPGILSGLIRRFELSRDIFG
jgi:hypothetical protein